MHLFSVISATIAINHILSKFHSLDYIFMAGNVCLASTSLTQLAFKSNAFSVILQNNGHQVPFWYRWIAHMQLPISQ